MQRIPREKERENITNNTNCIVFFTFKFSSCKYVLDQKVFIYVICILLCEHLNSYILCISQWTCFLIYHSNITVWVSYPAWGVLYACVQWQWWKHKSRPHQTHPSLCQHLAWYPSPAVFYLVVPLAEELKSLGSLVHKDSIQMTCLHRADLYGFLTPAHNLIRMDIGWNDKTKESHNW